LKLRVTSNERERNDVGQNFRNLMNTNNQLQNNMEQLQQTLGQKDAEIGRLFEERYFREIS